MGHQCAEWRGHATDAGDTKSTPQDRCRPSAHRLRPDSWISGEKDAVFIRRVTHQVQRVPEDLRKDVPLDLVVFQPGASSNRVLPPTTHAVSA